MSQKTVIVKEYKVAKLDDNQYHIFVEEMVRPAPVLRCSVKLANGRLCMNRVGCLTHAGLPTASLAEMEEVCPFPGCPIPRMVCLTWEHQMPENVSPLSPPSSRRPSGPFIYLLSPFLNILLRSLLLFLFFRYFQPGCFFPGSSSPATSPALPTVSFPAPGPAAVYLPQPPPLRGILRNGKSRKEAPGPNNSAPPKRLRFSC